MLRHYYKGELVWVAPGAVRYDEADLELIIPWLPEMREGAYPAEPSGGYQESRRPGIASRAHYEAACQVAAEIDNRLARTGLDRYLLESYYCGDWANCIYNEIITEIARQVSMERAEVRRRIRSAFSYIASGPCPRWLDCIDCPDYQRCRKKDNPPRKFTRQPVGVTYRQWRRSRSQAHA